MGIQHFWSCLIILKIIWFFYSFWNTLLISCSTFIHSLMQFLAPWNIFEAFRHAMITIFKRLCDSLWICLFYNLVLVFILIWIQEILGTPLSLHKLHKGWFKHSFHTCIWLFQNDRHKLQAGTILKNCSFKPQFTYSLL